MIFEKKILSMLPKSFYPGAIIENRAAEMFLKSLSQDKLVILISPTIRKNYSNELNFILDKNTLNTIEIKNEPNIKDKESVISKCREINPDIILAIGGGSVIDFAKVIKNELKKELIVLPTTFGSGSEVSQYSLFTDENKEKVVFSSKNMLPDIVLLIPKYLSSMSNEQISYSIVDELSHAIEGLVSKSSTKLTDILALTAIDIILENAEKAYTSKDINSLENLQISGLLAGIVQSTASVGLIHSIAHHIGPKQNLPHGKAISLRFLNVLRLNKSKTELYKKLDLCKNVNSSNFIETFENLFKKLNINLNVQLEADSNSIKNNICTKTNPYQPTIEDIDKIIKGGI